MNSPEGRESEDDVSAVGAPAWPIMDESIRDVFVALMASGDWGRYHGPHCLQLREALAEFHGLEHVVLCSSGTAAMELALRGVGVQAGDEVILAAYDFKSSFINVLTVGAVPVLADTLPGLPVLDPQQLPTAFSPRTRAVICSHLHGCQAPIRWIRDWAQAHGVAVIEDACQAPGAWIGESRAGTLGDAGILSFGGSKLLTSGRGGAVLTRDATIAQRIRLYTQRGNEAYPLSEMQAAVLQPQLSQLDERNRQRLRSVLRLQELLRDQTDIRLVVPQEWSAFYKLGFLLPGVSDRAISERVAAAARQRRVALNPGFPALQQIHSRRRFRPAGELTQASLLHHQLLTLHHPVLLDPGQLDHVAAVLRDVAANTLSAE